MKRLLLALTLLLGTLTSGQSQTNTYFPFPTDSAVWHEHDHPNGYPDSHYLFGIIGDTLLDSTLWHKLYIMPNCCGLGTTMTTANSNLNGAIREDSLKRVYYYCINPGIHTQTDSTYLLYDFSLQVGDTMVYDTSASFDYTYNYPYLVVDSIDSVLAYNKYRKRFYLQNETWIEGIGSLRSLLSIVTPIPTCFCVQELLCFNGNDTAFYIKPPLSSCFDTQNGIAAYTLPGFSISTIPNPFSAATTLHSDRLIENGNIIIYNSLGQNVKQMTNINGQEVVISRDGLPNGIYFLHLTEGEKTIAIVKLIIAN